LAIPRRNLPNTATGNSKANAQRNHRCAQGYVNIGPDSPIFKGEGGWNQGYYCQTAANGAHQIVTGAISNRASDVLHLQPMVERIVAITGQLPQKLIADTAYHSTDNIEQCWLHANPSTSRKQQGRRLRQSRGGPAATDLDGQEWMDLRSDPRQANQSKPNANTLFSRC